MIEGLRRLLASPRRRRRLSWLAAALAVVGIVALLALAVPTTTGTLTQTFEKGAPQVEIQIPALYTAAARRAVETAVSRFVATAVVRRHLAASYDLVTANLRQGMTRAKWAQGNIPVYPFPADLSKPESPYLLGSWRNDVLVDVLLVPRPGNVDVGPISFDVELKAEGQGAARRWLIDSFIPQHFFPPLASAKPIAATRARHRAHVRATPRTIRVVAPPRISRIGVDRGYLSRSWLLVPLGALALIVLIPIFFAVRGTLAGQRRRK